MQHYDVAPKEGWREFSGNEDLSNKIFDEGFERVNASEWFYINPATGMSIFEDKTGDYLFIETADKEESSPITDMHCGLSKPRSSEIARFIESYVSKFGLVLSEKDEI